jgi:hypothetical protein
MACIGSTDMFTTAIQFEMEKGYLAQLEVNQGPPPIEQSEK